MFVDRQGLFKTAVCVFMVCGVMQGKKPAPVASSPFLSAGAEELTPGMCCSPSVPAQVWQGTIGRRSAAFLSKQSGGQEGTAAL